MKCADMTSLDTLWRVYFSTNSSSCRWWQTEMWFTSIQYSSFLKSLFLVCFASSLQQSWAFLMSAADGCWKPSLQRCCLCIMLPLCGTFFIHNSLLLLTITISFKKWITTISKVAIEALLCLHTKDFDVNMPPPPHTHSNESIILRLRHFLLTLRCILNIHTFYDVTTALNIHTVPVQEENKDMSSLIKSRFAAKGHPCPPEEEQTTGALLNFLQWSQFLQKHIWRWCIAPNLQEVQQFHLEQMLDDDRMFSAFQLRSTVIHTFCTYLDSSAYLTQAITD